VLGGGDRAVELVLRAGAAGLRQSLSHLALLGGVLIVAVAAIIASGRTPDSRF